MSDSPCSRCGLRPKPIRRIDQPSPFAAYFNGIPLDQNPSATPLTRAEIEAFIHKMENELLDFDADIARVEEALRLLKQQREAGESFVARHKSILSRLHSLPPEVLLEIFRHCLDQKLDQLDRPGYSFNSEPGLELPTPWVLSAVCRRWRNILRQSPSYWSTFEVSIQPLQLLADALKLSGQAPLHFYFDLDFGEEACKALAQNSSRWRTIFISGTRRAFVSLNHLGHLPILTKLCISLEAYRYEDEDEDSDSDTDEITDFTTVLSPFSDCSQLDELYLDLQRGYAVSEIILRTESLSIPWANLSKLTVVSGPHSSRMIHSLLLACTNLRQLIVRVLRGLTGLTVDHTPLEVTQSSITSLTVDHAFHLVQHVEFSVLTHLSIHIWAPRHFLPFLSRNYRNISHIEVSIEPSGGVEDWAPVMRLLTDVVHFTAHFYSQPPHSWDVLSKILGPKIQTLIVHTGCHLLEFCEQVDIVPLILSRWPAGTLRTLEIYFARKRTGYYSSMTTPVVSRMVENTDTMKALRVFKEEGLEVKLNDIPLPDRPVLLHM